MKLRLKSYIFIFTEELEFYFEKYIHVQTFHVFFTVSQLYSESNE